MFELAIHFGRHRNARQAVSEGAAEPLGSRREYFNTATAIADECRAYYSNLAGRIVSLPQVRLGATEQGHAEISGNWMVSVRERPSLVVPEGLDVYSLRRTIAHRAVHAVQAERLSMRMSMEHLWNRTYNRVAKSSIGNGRPPYYFREGRTRHAVLEAEALLFSEAFAARPGHDEREQLGAMLVWLGANTEHMPSAIRYMSMILKDESNQRRRLKKLRRIERLEAGDAALGTRTKIYEAALQAIVMAREMSGLDAGAHAMNSIVNTEIPELLALIVLGARKGDLGEAMKLLSGTSAVQLVNVLKYDFIEDETAEKVASRLTSMLRYDF